MLTDTVGPIAWHYSHARHVKSIIDSGEVRPAVAPMPNEFSRHQRPYLFFTLNEFWEPTIYPLLNVRKLFVARYAQEHIALPGDLLEGFDDDFKASGGGWVRFGYPARHLHSWTENWPAPTPEARPCVERAVYRAYADSGNPEYVQIVQNWRVSFDPIAVPDFAMIESMDDSLTWRRIWTNPEMMELPASASSGTTLQAEISHVGVQAFMWRSSSAFGVSWPAM